MITRRSLFKSLFGALTALFVGSNVKSEPAKAKLPEEINGAEYVCDLPEGCDRLYCDWNDTVYATNGSMVYYFDGVKFQEINNLISESRYD